MISGNAQVNKQLTFESWEIFKWISLGFCTKQKQKNCNGIDCHNQKFYRKSIARSLKTFRYCTTRILAGFGPFFRLQNEIYLIRSSLQNPGLNRSGIGDLKFRGPKKCPKQLKKLIFWVNGLSKSNELLDGERLPYCFSMISVSIDIQGTASKWEPFSFFSRLKC